MSHEPSRTSALVGAAMSLVAAASTAKACDVALDEALQPAIVTYEPFGVTDAVGVSELTLRNLGDEEELDLFFQPSAFGDPAPFSITAELVAAARPLSRVDQDRYRFTLPRGETARIGFTARVTADGVPEPGQRDLTFELDVVSTATGLPCIENALLPIRITTPSSAQVNIAGAAGRYTDGPDLYTLDFGSLESGLSRRLALQLRANGEASLSIRSENGGRLVHEDRPDAIVPYTMVLDGSTLNLAAETSLPAPPARSEAGVSLPLDVTIGEVGPLPSGRFSDLVTITVTAL